MQNLDPEPTLAEELAAPTAPTPSSSVTAFVHLAKRPESNNIAAVTLIRDSVQRKVDFYCNCGTDAPEVNAVKYCIEAEQASGSMSKIKIIIIYYKNKNNNILK